MFNTRDLRSSFMNHECGGKLEEIPEMTSNDVRDAAIKLRSVEVDADGAKEYKFHEKKNIPVCSLSDSLLFEGNK